ncbi:MAG: hypothetical protein PHH04_05570 [Thomasclavelia sp.]|nr:hypothetical protein [Thomasclavelia sp.]
MGKTLDKIDFIPYQEEYSLADFVINYIKVLDNKQFSINDGKEAINIVFQTRHYPHIIGLHHYQDSHSQNKTMKNVFNLKGNTAIKYILHNKIQMSDLVNAYGGTIFNKDIYKYRVLSSHLIERMILNSKLYKVCGIIKNNVKADYILVSNIDQIKFCLCLKIDNKLNRDGHTYCCVSNLINDRDVNGAIKDGRLQEININNIVKKDFKTKRIIYAKTCNCIFDKPNPGISINKVSEACVIEVIELDGNCVAKIIDEDCYEIKCYFYDKNTKRIINKYL